MKEIFGIIAIILAIVAYVPYFRDIIKGKTKPHVYTWFVWGFITCIIFALQIKGGAGIGAYVTLLTGIFSFVVFLLGLKFGDKDITFSDTVFFISALLATVLWVFAKQPVLSVVLLVVIDLLGFIPTIRKSWNKPFSETLFTWELNAFRHGLSIFALLQYNILTLFYPVAWTSACVLFSVMLIARRKIINI
jgi:hypothetical protein